MNLFNSEDIFIVTGASSGIGKATAIAIVEAGGKVVAISRNNDMLLQAKSECIDSDAFFIEKCDLTEHLEDMPLFLMQLKEKYGKFTGIAYCAGDILLKPANNTSYKECIDLFNINYFAPYMMIKSFMDKRICVAGKASALAVASADAFLREKGLSAYSGTKAALQASLSTLAKEVASRGMRVNTVSPSDIKTPMTMNDAMTLLRQGRESKYPLGYGEPKDVANVIIFLLSEKSKWITGHDYIVDCATF